MHKLFAKLLTKASSASGAVNIEVLGELVSKAFEEADNDRRRVDRSMALMIEELDQLTRGLEITAEQRTGELRQRERELRNQNDRFEAAINNMSHGLAMYDAQGRLVICNQRYVDMYKLPPDEVRPGSTIWEVFRMRLEAGTFGGDPDATASELLAECRARRAATRTTELPDGRTISVVGRGTPDGGWVATHEDITDRRRVELKVAHMAHHDALTDLPNRMMLQQWIEQAVTHAKRGHSVAVHYLDLDHFKTVNDTLGHPIGDELLLAVTQRLKHTVRENEMVARVGGDEFAIVQAGVVAPADAAALARRIRETLSAPYNLNGHVAIVDASIGIALAPGDGREPHVLMKNADMALYRAKGEGRGTYRFFEPDMDARMQARRTLELTLREALPRNEFELHYQPVLNLATNRITSCEALIRWNHPERGMISPAEFVQVAEDIGLIGQMGEWVLHHAFAEAANWPKEVKVAVNLSPTQLADRQIVPIITGALAAAGLPAQRLVVEITEAVLIRNTEATLAALHQLRELGVEIALDDFGTGYSSLNYLRSFPFDKIKIDRCFVKGLDDGDESGTIMRAITGLAASLNIKTTAEGVETQAQLEQVRALGCNEMQGYLFSRPLPLADLQALFRRGLTLTRSAA